MRLVSLFVLLSTVVLGAGSAAAEDVNMLVALDERANRPAQPFVPREELAHTASALVLFTMTGPNNAVCIRGVNDVTGDGLGEVMVGIDQSGVPNVFCLDGSSSGTATVVWSHQTSTGVSGGSPYGDQSVVPISDADGNGYQNVLVGTAWGGRTAYSFDSLDGTVRWKFDTYLAPYSGWVYSLAELNDATGDSVPDVVFGAGSDNNSLYMVDGASAGGLGSQATVVWSSDVVDAVYGVRDLGDVNGDGMHDALVAVGDNVDVLYCYSGGSSPPTGDVLWSYAPGTSLYACGVLPDVTGDGVNEALAVLWIMGGSAVRCRSGATGGAVWTSTAVADYGMMVDAFADVTGDGKAEVIVSSWENAVIVLSGADGSQVWKTTVGTLNGGDVWTARAIGDLNGDGYQDVVAGSFDYHVYALSGVDGSTIWSYSTGNRVYSVAPLGDFNADGRPEVGVATQDTTSSTVVYVLTTDKCTDPTPAPAITDIADESSCAQSGIRVTYTPSSDPDVERHDLVRDNVVVVSGYVSGALYNPGDTASHSYAVRAVDSTCSTDSASQDFADANATPANPAAPVVIDLDACAQSGVQVSWGAVSGATGYDLWVDGTVLVSDVTSPYAYNPGDSAPHSYQVRAKNATCTGAWSTATAGTDVDGTPTATVVNVSDVNPCEPGSLSVAWEAAAGATGYDLRIDGGTVITDVTTPYLFVPGDLASHTFEVQAKNAACVAPWSAPTSFADGGPMADAVFCDSFETDDTSGWVQTLP